MLCIRIQFGAAENGGRGEGEGEREKKPANTRSQPNPNPHFQGRALEICISVNLCVILSSGKFVKHHTDDPCPMSSSY